MMQTSTFFQRWDKLILFLAPWNFIHFWPASTLLRGHLALSLLVNDPQISERWDCADEVHLGKYPSEGFGLEFQRDLQWPLWVSHVGLVSACLSSSSEYTFGGFISWNTQPNCRAFDDRRPAGPRFNSWSRFLSGRPDLPWLLSRLTTSCRTLSCKSFFFNMATALLSSFFLDLLLGCSSTWRCAYEHTFPQNGNHSWSCRTSILEGATFHRTSCCKFLWGNPCKAIDTFYRWGFFPWDLGFSTRLSHSAAWKNSETYSTVSFFHAYLHRDANCNCLLSHTARWTLIANNLQFYTLFCSLILDHDVSFIISIYGAKILISYILLDTSFHHRFQSVVINPNFFWWISKSYNSNTVLSFSDSRILNLYNPTKMSSGGTFVIDNKNSIPLWVEFPNIIISKTNGE